TVTETDRLVRSGIFPTHANRRLPMIETIFLQLAGRSLNSMGGTPSYSELRSLRPSPAAVKNNGENNSRQQVIKQKRRHQKTPPLARQSGITRLRNNALELGCHNQTLFGNSRWP